MTELEFQRAKRHYEQMTRRARWGRLLNWLKGIFSLKDPGQTRKSPDQKRLERLARKAEVERKARQAL